MNNYKNSLYDQSTSLRTAIFCAQLKSTGNVELVIEHIGKRFCKQSWDSPTTEPKAKDRNDLHLLYNHQNIEKEHQAFLANGTLTRNNMESAYELYRYSLKLILNYCEKNSSISDYQSFCLHFFLATLYSRLPELDSAAKAAENYSRAFAFAAKLHVLDPAHLSRTQPKNLAICISDGIGYQDVLIEDALFSKTYIDPEICHSFKLDPLVCFADTKIRSKIRNCDDLFACGLDDLPQLYKSIACTKFSNLVLMVNALDALAHNRFKILFLDEMANKQATGFYNFRNTVRVLASEGPENIRGTLFHELTHKTMNQVFDNRCIPYFKNDQNAKQAYRDSMKQVLLNLISFSGLVYIDVNKLSLNVLIQVCFGERFLMDAIKGKNEPYILKLLQKLDVVFGGPYSVAHLDVEFITNTLHYLINVKNDSPYMYCIQPLLDYIDKFVIPVMEKYITEHPMRRRLKV